MGVPLIAAGASFLSKKLLKDALKRKMIRREIANNPSFYKIAADPNKLKIAKLTGNSNDSIGALTNAGNFVKSGLINPGWKTGLVVGGFGGLAANDAYNKYKNANNVTVEDINNAWQGLPGPTVEELEGTAGTASVVKEVERTGKDYNMDYITQDQRDMINYFSKIDSMNLTHQAKEMLKEDYLRKRTGTAVTEQEDYNLEKELREETGAAYTGGEIDTFMGLLRRKKSPRSEIDFDSLYR